MYVTLPRVIVVAVFRGLLVMLIKETRLKRIAQKRELRRHADVVPLLPFCSSRCATSCARFWVVTVVSDWNDADDGRRAGVAGWELGDWIT